MSKYLKSFLLGTALTAATATTAFADGTHTDHRGGACPYHATAPWRLSIAREPPTFGLAQASSHELGCVCVCVCLCV